MLTPFLAQLDVVDAGLTALQDDHEAWTYGELRSHGAAVGAALRQRHGGDRYVVVLMRPGVRAVGVLLGVMHGGSTPVPVDPDLPPSALEYITAKSGAPVVVDPASTTLWEGAPGVAQGPGDPARPALVLFTSGTTGYPKGVIVSQANLAHSCATICDYLDYHRWRSAAVVLPLHYSYGLVSQVLCQLSIGGRVVIHPSMRNPIKVARRIRELGLETFCGVPSTYQALATVHAMSPIPMPSVRVICSAGAALDTARIAPMRQIFPAAVLFNNYGMTEAAPRIAYIRDDDPRFGEPTCGRPMQGVEVKVINRETGAALPDGEAGMLVVRGPNITSGYLNDPELTDAAFTPDGFLISGDMARLRDGYIYIEGRYDDVFNVGGEKVSPLEVERALSLHPAVEQVAVRGVPDPQRGHVPVAFLLLRKPVSRKDLLAAASQRLTPVRLPARFLEVTSFPMTANGKVQRRLLSADDPERVLREID